VSAVPNLGLAMIVRNEAAVIERCLRSIKDHIGYWTIIDTGSTDGTPYIIRELLSEIPGALYDRPWVDFGHNRTELMELARGTAQQLVLLDADMVVLIGGDGVSSIDIEADINELLVSGGVEYKMPYIVHGDRPWRFHGSTHEYLDGDFEKRTHFVNGVSFFHHGDGGFKSDKFVRDEILLRRQIRSEPDNPRWYFYLAQTRQNLGDSEGAIAAFRRRIELGGWDEEVFWSLLSIGELLEARGDWPEATIALLAAWEFRPTRAESLMVLASGFRSRNMYATAKIYAELGQNIPLPQDRLFVRRWVYDWGLDFEQSVAGWWMGSTEAARTTWQTLLARTDLDEAHRDAIESNLILQV
jgi:glycosyltransferase involved in cell wall biosynthesis